MWTDYHQPQTLRAALDLLAHYAAAAVPARLIAGGTDVLIELDRGVRKPCALIDVSRLGLDGISLDAAGDVHIGPQATHADVVASALCVGRAFPLAQACREVGAPQIRNRGTLAGNLVTASPANDTIAPLIALDARVTLASSRGERIVPLRDFHTGVRRTVLAPDEMLVDIAFPALGPNRRGAYLKLGLRRAQAISVVNCAAVLGFDAAGRVADARIALGAVAPTIVRAPEAEAALSGEALTGDVIARAAALAQRAASPIDDVRGSAEYRRDMVGALVERALAQLAAGSERDAWAEPALLRPGPRRSEPAPARARPDAIRTRINGRPVEVAGAAHKTLLRMLREDCGLVGTKEGCAEGECGACTVLLDGQAVMACLVPAPRADGADIVTVEGVAPGTDVLHPLQQAFIDSGAVQCGYCTPGFIVSGAALLAENARPGEGQLREAISGNLCRCTGYYAILDALRRASASPPASGLPSPEAVEGVEGDTP